MSIDFYERLLGERNDDLTPDRVGQGVSRDEDRRLVKDMRHSLMLLDGLFGELEENGGLKSLNKVSAIYLNILKQLDILEDRNSWYVGNCYGEEL